MRVLDVYSKFVGRGEKEGSIRCCAFQNTCRQWPLDARLVWARRGRELYEAVLADLGGLDRLSTTQEQLIRRLSGLCCVAESIEAELAQGKMPTGEALSEYVGAINCLRRVAATLGLRRVPKEIPDLDAYLHSRYGNGVEIEG